MLFKQSTWTNWVLSHGSSVIKTKEKIEDPSEKEKTLPKETALPEPKYPKVGKEIPLGFDPKMTSNPNNKKQDLKGSQSPSAQDPKEIQKTGADTQALVYPITPTPLTSKGTKHEALEEVIPLSEYKFDHNRLAVVKSTPKRKRDPIGGVEKAFNEGYEESTLWDISGLNVAHVVVETLAIIVEMALVGQLSLEAMAKEIVRLKKLATQAQNELAKNVKNVTKDKQKSLEELRIA